MKVYGITGGVGAGKTSVLELIKGMTNCRIIIADELAKSLEKKGQPCYEPLVGLLGRDILDENEEIDKKKMAQAIFLNKEDNLSRVNAIIHPEVKKRILEIIDNETAKGEIDYLFIEAALLIEDGYDCICDEIWYLYADESVRRKRLKESRGYTDDKIDAILASQLDEATFRKYCKTVLDNSGDLKATENQIKHIFGR